MSKIIGGKWHATRKYEVAPYAEKPYYRRKCSRYVDADGRRIDAITTRYTTELRKRPRTDDVTGKPYYEQYAPNTYYADGLFYEVRRSHDVGAHGEILRSYYLAPLSGILTDAHPIKSEKQGIEPITIEVDEGHPIAATHKECGTIWTNAEPIEMLLLYMALI